MRDRLHGWFQKPERSKEETQKRRQASQALKTAYEAFVARDYRRAEEAARQCCRENLAFKHERLMITVCLMRQGRVDEARAKVRETESFEATNPWGPFEMWLDRLLVGQADLTQVLNVATDDHQRSQAYYYEGARLLTASESAGARQAFERCLDFEIAHPEAFLAAKELALLDRAQARS